MVKEISDIVEAFKEAQKHGRRTALATVVHVEGSSYRRPGARMLVEDNGRITGAISGGCLEGDALKKALLAINQGQNKLVTYDTLHEDDIEFGVQLGCNGIVHILFEPINLLEAYNPIALLEKCLVMRKDAVLVTMFSLKNYHGFQPGTCFFYNNESAFGEVDDNELESELKQDASEAINTGSSFLKQYNNQVLGYVELLKPRVNLVIVGAGNDALPMVDMATVLGWTITVVDGRATHATRNRFPKVDKVVIAKPAEVIRHVVIDERTVFVLMTHNYNYDLELLKLLLQTDVNYIGSLGPKKRLERILTELDEQGVIITDEQREKIYGPTGINIGAEAAEEIALSVLAEIKAVLSNQNGTFLRDRSEAIHSRLPVETAV